VKAKKQDKNRASRALTRREFLRLSAITGAGLVVAGCGGSAAPAPATEAPAQAVATQVPEQAAAKETTVEFWQFWCSEEGKKNWMDETAAAYMQANPGVTIVDTCYDKDPLFQAMRTAFGAGEGPDTFYFDPYPYHDIDWVNKGFFADLSPYLDADRYVPGYFDPLAYNDAIYGVPVEGYVMNMWYNKNIFDELGLVVPESREVELDEFEGWCRKIRQDKGIAPMANAFMDLHHFASVYVGCMLYRNLGLDGYKALGRGELAWTEPEVKESVARVEGWFKEGFMNVDAGGISTPDSYSLMFQSKAAMNYRGGWILGQSRNDPEKGGAPEDVEVDFFRFPILPGGPGNSIIDGGTGGCFGVSAQSNVLETTANYLKFLSSEDWGQKWIAMTQGLTGIKASPPAGVDPLVVAQADQTGTYDVVLRMDTQTHGKLRDAWVHEAGPELATGQIDTEGFVTKLEDARKQDMG